MDVRSLKAGDMQAGGLWVALGQCGRGGGGAHVCGTQAPRCGWDSGPGGRTAGDYDPFVPSRAEGNEWLPFW